MFSRYTLPIILAACCLATLASAQSIDLTKSVVVRGSDDPVVAKAVTVLVEEVEKRSGTKFVEAAAVPAGDAPAIVAVLAKDLAKLNGKPADGLSIRDKPEAYAIWHTGANNAKIWIAGHDARGVMFGVGHLLRKLEMRPGKITLPAPLRYAGAPFELPLPGVLHHAPRHGLYARGGADDDGRGLHRLQRRQALAYEVGQAGGVDQMDAAAAMCGMHERGLQRMLGLDLQRVMVADRAAALHAAGRRDGAAVQQHRAAVG